MIKHMCLILFVRRRTAHCNVPHNESHFSSTVTDVRGMQRDLGCLPKSNSRDDLNTLRPNGQNDDHLRVSHVTDIQVCKNS